MSMYHPLVKPRGNDSPGIYLNYLANAFSVRSSLNDLKTHLNYNVTHDQKFKEK